VSFGLFRKSSSAVPLATALLIALGIPLSASSVTYDFHAVSNGIGATFTTTDFLPVLYPDVTVFSLTSGPGRVANVNCGALPSYLRCGNAYLQLNQYGSATGFISVSGTGQLPFDTTNILEATFFDVDLKHVGQWTTGGNYATLIISQSNDPVPTPEPASFLLAAPALAGLWFMRRRTAA
jgi:MYXO-CTERM domain-containing protein